ncbi:phosphoglycerate mutase [Fictibacillus arsenicus]|uniref:Phosphoglycerate mutase n=1 Tax=Fictibacillus arsenicus TaxID=255247 RepID=A0A1B1Z2T9_9BACL|nr:histidine phosphatase family protein [Fictibacillus arsenicus]ANX11701.1 phosphoglycerate mutase [Fictibacillus arsenicus]
MIYVVRHGQTDLNKEGRLQGRFGLPLNDQGIEQAEALKMELTDITFDYVFSSPQERAVQTAEFATGKRAVVDSRLDVFDLGEADRLKKEEVKMAGLIPDASVYEGVEDIHSFMERVFSFMEELEENPNFVNKNILISGHRCTTGAIGAYINGMPEDQNILRYSSDNGKYKMYDLNRVSQVIR